MSVWHLPILELLLIVNHWTEAIRRFFWILTSEFKACSRLTTFEFLLDFTSKFEQPLKLSFNTPTLETFEFTFEKTSGSDNNNNNNNNITETEEIWVSSKE